MTVLINRLSVIISVVLTGLSAGFFTTYYYSVTRALAVVDDSTYVGVFQAINATVRSPEFGVVFFGSAVAILIALAINRNVPRFRLLLGSALVAYLGLMAITFGVHVPLNNELAAASTQTTTLAAQARLVFECPWNEWHAARTVFALLAFGLTVTAATIDPRNA